MNSFSLIACVVFSALSQFFYVQAGYCKFGEYSYYTYKYCNYGCCTDGCCDYTQATLSKTETWVIAVSVVGSFIAVSLISSAIIAIVRHQQRSRVAPSQPSPTAPPAIQPVAPPAIQPAAPPAIQPAAPVHSPYIHPGASPGIHHAAPAALPPIHDLAHPTAFLPLSTAAHPSIQPAPLPPIRQVKPISPVIVPAGVMQPLQAPAGDNSQPKHYGPPPPYHLYIPAAVVPPARPQIAEARDIPLMPEPPDLNDDAQQLAEEDALPSSRGQSPQLSTSSLSSGCSLDGEPAPDTVQQSAESLSCQESTASLSSASEDDESTPDNAQPSAMDATVPQSAVDARSSQSCQQSTSSLSSASVDEESFPDNSRPSEMDAIAQSPPLSHLGPQ